ncbi:hypothetical protein U1763_02420 [Sphingomonas sp. LB2R24]|uniref:hypothetical protein n=1 Tax=Sphingomonas sorbitolis TaxID=3096165 RepID=UPI002FC91957
MVGEAKGRRIAYEASKNRVLSEMSGDGAAVAETAIRLFERFVVPNRYTGGCYLVTMFLNRYLERERGVTTTPVVGYVNDGTDDIMVSHAWLELDGLKTDITLHFTQHPEIQLPGALLVMDRPLLAGRVEHSYHREMNDAGRAENARLSRSEARHVLQRKAVEHAFMVKCMTDPDLMDAHQAGAPPGLRYADFSAVLG